MPPALWRSFPLCFIRYGFSRAPGVFQLRNSPGSKERSDRGDFAKGCLLPSRTPAVRLRAPASRAHARGPHLLCLNVCAVTSLLRPTAVTGRPGRDAAPRALSPGAAPLCAFARCRRSESRAGVPGRGETPFASPQRPRPASGAGTAPGPTQEAPPCWPPPGRPANLSRAGPASFPFSRPGNSAGAGRMAASASFYTHYTPETQPLRTDCLRVTAGKGLRAPGGRKEGGMGGEGGGQGGVCGLQPRVLMRSASSWDAASRGAGPLLPASASLSPISSEPAALLQVFPGRRAGFQASTCLRCRNYVKLITGLPGGSDGKASGGLGSIPGSGRSP